MTNIKHDTAAALVDGVEMPLDAATMAVTDEGVSRGDGAFETVGVWDGRPFRLEAHLSRLNSSLAKMLLPPADLAALHADVAALLDGIHDDAALRCYVTGSGTRVVTLSEQPLRVALHHLVPQLAPWIVPPKQHPPAGAKSMSYGPNMTATRAAAQAGGDDALLVTADGTVLEGPTFCVMWAAAGVVHSVPVELGIVDSISRRTLRELAEQAGYRVQDAEVDVATLGEADEVFVCSSVRPLAAVQRIGPHRFESPHPVTDELGAALDAARRATNAAQSCRTMASTSPPCHRSHS